MAESGSCDLCQCVSHDLRLVSDGTDSGESDLLCPKCRGEPADSTGEFDDECEECGAPTTYPYEFCQRCAEILDAEAEGGSDEDLSVV